MDPMTEVKILTSTLPAIDEVSRLAMRFEGDEAKAALQHVRDYVDTLLAALDVINSDLDDSDKAVVLTGIIDQYMPLPD